jgi:hypothetical protein
LSVALQPRVEVLRYHSPQTQRRGERLASVDELVERLAESGFVQR